MPQAPSLRTDPFFTIHIMHLPTSENVSFEGWVTQFSDSFNSNWSSTPVYGRQDPLPAFESTQRTITLGFDVAIVLSKEVNQNRINTRAQKSVCLNTGLHLGKILEEISCKYNGNGGGHDGAATLTSTLESDTIITQIIEKIKQYF